MRTNTPMHDSKLGALTWLTATYLTLSHPKGLSSIQLAAELGITQKLAWHLGTASGRYSPPTSCPDSTGR